MKHDRAYKTGTMRSMYGPGPEGEICKSCTHLICHVRDRRWYKCKAYGTSSSEATDWGCTWPTCGLFTYDPDAELPPDFVTVVENRKHASHPKKMEPELTGQIDMEELLDRNNSKS